MSHRTGGLLRLLEWPRCYEALQRLVGSSTIRPRFVAKYLRPQPGDRILDIGCGTGSILDHLPAGIEYVGYDLNPRYIELARRQHGQRGTFYCGRVGEHPQSVVGLFDVVLAKSILHHLSEREMRALVDTAYAALRPGGVLVTFDPVRHPRQHLVSRLLIGADRGQNVLDEEGYRAVLGIRFRRVEGRVVTDLSPRIPFSHFIARATKQGDASPAEATQPSPGP